MTDGWDSVCRRSAYPEEVSPSSSITPKHRINPIDRTPLAIAGNFSGLPKQQNIVLAKPTSLVIARIVVLPDESARILVLLEQPLFVQIRSISAFRVTGGSKDYIIVGTDSGTITILEYIPKDHRLKQIHCETFGKSGTRRVVPGEYLACDPKGRAVMIGALEKQKFVYVLNRDSATNLTISSPLESHKAHTLTLALVGIDVDFDNPVFAAIEVEYTQVDQTAMSGDPTMAYADKYLTLYELDLGLNHVVRKWSEPIDPTAHHLIPIPGGADGPSGMLVCCENMIAYKHMDQPELKIPIPRRENPLENVSRGLIIIASVVHRLKNRFFVLVQSDDGDLYRITMTVSPETGMVADLKIKYFDSVPVSCSLVILRAGYLVVIAEFGNSHIYRIEDLGDSDAHAIEYSAVDMDSAGQAPDEFVHFKVRECLNLELVGEINALNPIMCSTISNLAGEEAPQIYALCGRGPNSSLRILRQGIEFSELAVTSVPGKPTGIWTTKSRVADLFDTYIVVSFASSTVVFAVGETVEEVHDSGLADTVQTLWVQCMGIDDLVQVHPLGVRHVKNASTARGGSVGRLFEWRVPENVRVTHAVANTRQVLLALSTNDIVYFELDLATGMLNEHPTRPQMSAPITCLDLGYVPPGRVRNRYAGVGCGDSTVRILALDPEECMDPVSMQALNSMPISLCTIDMPDVTKPNDADAIVTYLYIGLQNGVLIRSAVDPKGDLIDARLRFLGPRAPRLVRAHVNQGNAMLALSTRTWLSYAHHGRSLMSPVQYTVPLDYAAGFATEMYPEAVVATSSTSIHIILPDKLGQPMSVAESVPLAYTPRCPPVFHPMSAHIVIAQGDANTYAPMEIASRLEDLALQSQNPGLAFYRDEVPEAKFGLIKASKGKWAGCLQVIHPIDGLVSQVPLDIDETPVSLTVVQFSSPSALPGEYYVVVGTVTQLVYPRTVQDASLRTYLFLEGGTRLELVHVTPLGSGDGLPRALAPFHGQLLVGIGTQIRLYDLGIKRLLKKAENRQVPTQITWIGVQGVRLWITDQQESVHVAMYRPTDHRIVVFADDILPRWVTAITLLDYDTACIGDKFGNIAVVRVPSDLSREIDDDPTGNRVMYERPLLQGAAHKLQHVNEFFVGDMVTSITRAALVSGGREVLVYSTLSGCMGCLIPFQSKDDVDFFTILEEKMRIAAGSLVNRDHLRYRSLYKPVRNVFDGDLIEQFMLMPGEEKQHLAEEMDRTVLEISKRIEDLRARSAF